ncbi:MAG: hypothetical protein HYS27_06695 [Deltaproteobacteria bacterium]|nr:hypothetical protein [Deltaproteobacteria bacterium]
MSFGPRALALALPLVAGCLSAPPARPDVDVRLERDLRGTACGVEPGLVLGTVPEGAVELSRVHLSSKPRPLARYQRALRALARERCAAGVSLLNAEEEGGGVVRAEAVLWLRPAEGTSP